MSLDFGDIKNKNEKENEKLIDNIMKDIDYKFTLSQKEVHLFGELLLEKIQRKYQGLIQEPDYCWELDNDLKLINKLITIVVLLQGGKILKESEKPKEKDNFYENN